MASRIQGEVATRVVIIETLYQETDVHNFKSVVQRLTGKEAGVEKRQEIRSRHHQRGGDVDNIDKKRRRRTHASPPPRHPTAVVVSTCEMSSDGSDRPLSLSSFKEDGTQGLWFDWFPDLPQQMEELPSWLWEEELIS